MLPAGAAEIGAGGLVAVLLAREVFAFAYAKNGRAKNTETSADLARAINRLADNVGAQSQVFERILVRLEPPGARDAGP